MTRQSKENLKFHVERRIPFEIEKCYTGLNIVLRKAFDITNLENAKISEVLSGHPIAKELVNKFKIKREELEEAANEIQREREKDR